MNDEKHSLVCRGLEKQFDEAVQSVNVLKDIHASIARGDEIAIVGASGSGKTTFLQFLGGLDRPTRGQICWEGVDLQTLSDNAVAERRNHLMGFVYQFHHLLSEFNALENVSMPLRIRRVPFRQAMERAAEALHEVGLGHRLTHLPAQLSGGERQRVAIARAIVHEPHYILADEPTGNLDRKTAEQVFELLQTLNRKHNTALVVVTHDLQVAAAMRHTWVLEDGYLKTD